MHLTCALPHWLKPVLLAGIVSVWLARAQDTDTVILKNSPQTLTILSQVDNPQERHDFTEVYRAKDPAQRQTLAEGFIKAYPQSWLLAEAFDLAAKSSIDLGDYPRALAEGRFSLRLMPENATLLILMANLEARNKLFNEARASAENALANLDLFARPGNMSEAEWNQIQPKLKASAYFALGRSEAGEGLAKASPSRPGLLAQAAEALDRAAAWNGDDPEIFYLRALVELNRGKSSKAASDLAFVAKTSNPLSPNALDGLRRLYKESASASNLTLDKFVAGQPEPEINASLRNERVYSTPSVAIRAGYAGSAACRSCHAHEYNTWRQTGMAKMLREYKLENIIGDFSPGTEFKDEEGVPLVRMGADTRPYFDVKDSKGKWRRFHVDYTIGSKWQQGYATKLPDGSFHVLPIEYNVLRKAWVNYWKIIDPPGSARAVITDFPELSPATNYQENCAICHSSQLSASTSTNPMEHATFREPGVNCEMCHGPSAWHIRQMRDGHMAKTDLMEPPVDFRKIDNRAGVRVCAQCHRQTAVRELGEKQEMNFAAEGASFVPRSWSRPYDAFSRRAFYKDGRFRETTFTVEAFTRSACYRKGTAQCATCHAPHVPDFSNNLTSLKFKDNPDEMCLRCHDQYRARVSEHTHHTAGSEASQCVSCHMPRIVNALLFQARSHEIEIPRADLTERFGQKESPNACLICHAEKGAQWAEDKLARW